MSTSAEPPMFLTPALIQADTGSGIRQISQMPGFEWVALIRGSMLTPSLLQAICDLANAYTGAKPASLALPTTA